MYIVSAGRASYKIIGLRPTWNKKGIFKAKVNQNFTDPVQQGIYKCFTTKQFFHIFQRAESERQTLTLSRLESGWVISFKTWNIKFEWFCAPDSLKRVLTPEILICEFLVHKSSYLIHWTGRRKLQLPKLATLWHEQLIQAAIWYLPATYETYTREGLSSSPPMVPGICDL